MISSHKLICLRQLRVSFAAVVLAMATTQIQAAVSLPKIFANNLVLQQDTEVNIWGSASPGESVTVSGSWSANTVTTTADNSGAWELKLPTPVANTDGTVYTLTIRGTNQITLTNVAIGEVWLISGQSNVNIALNSNNVEGGSAAISSANFPQIRLLRMGDRPSSQPQDEYPENSGFRRWTICSHSTVGSFSAVGFFFARDLHQHTGIPVAMIQSAKAGSTAQAWTPIEELYQIDEYAGQGPWTPGTGNNAHTPSIYYNGTIAPLRKFTIRGVLWYQGETNVDLDDPEIFAETLPKLIQGWRRVWDQGDFPFYLVNIVPWPDYLNDSWPEVIEGQNSVLSLPNTGLAATIDLASSSLHPGQKREVGERLSLLARSRIHGEDIIDSGPLYAGMQTEGDLLRVYFDYAGDGLFLSGSNPQFEIAAEDHIFHPASATVDGDTLLLSSTAVQEPIHVRYAWNTYPAASLFNAEGLPSPPFRTDIPDYIPSILGYHAHQWAGYNVINNEFVDTQAMAGWLNIRNSPWVYSYNLMSWIYLSEDFVQPDGTWLYVLK